MEYKIDRRFTDKDTQVHTIVDWCYSNGEKYVEKDCDSLYFGFLILRNRYGLLFKFSMPNWEVTDSIRNEFFHVFHVSPRDERLIPYKEVNKKC